MRSYLRLLRWIKVRIGGPFGLGLTTAVILVSGLTGCAAPNPPLTLAERFERVALRDDAGRPIDYLYPWPNAVRVEYHGPEEFRQAVEDHTALIGTLTDLDTSIVRTGGNMVVRIAPRAELQTIANKASQELYGRDTGAFTCFGTPLPTETGWERADLIGIVSELPDWHIRLCIVQEMTQALGLFGDLDGRTDTNFTSKGNVAELTDYDRQLVAILFDDRFYYGMPREEVLAILPEIVADVEAEQELR